MVPLLAVVLGVGIAAAVLRDALETIVLPRTVSRRFGFSTWNTRLLKSLYRLVGTRVQAASGLREKLLGALGPLSLLLLIAEWAWLLVISITLVEWGLGIPLEPGGENSFWVHLYVSAVTFFTVGYGDVVSITPLGRAINVIEASLGFGFLALVIGYIPVLYGSFSRREATILLLDARAGSPPTAGELLKRYDQRGIDALQALLSDLERWCANLLESYLSYPMLALYRSQHEKMSWLGALTMIMDSCALLEVGCDAKDASHNGLMRQAELSFALARHVVVDLAYVLDIPPQHPPADRLPPEEWDRLVATLQGKGLLVCDKAAAYSRLNEIRHEYESYVYGVSEALMLPLPPWLPADGAKDSWQVAAWDEDGHF